MKLQKEKNNSYSGQTNNMESKKCAIVVGHKGMLGSHMTDLLQSKGYYVKFLHKGVSVKEDLRALIVYNVPEAIYNFAGYSNVFNSYADLTEMIESNLMLPLQILETIHEVNPKVKFFQASSALIFGKNEGAQNEQSHYNPLHPYGSIKLATQLLTQQYREDKELHACSAILFPTESSRRGKDFFTKKVCAAAVRIKNGSKEKFKLNRFPDCRDWSHTSDVCEAAYLMMQADKAKDYVIGSGVTYSTNEFIKFVCDRIGLNYNECTEYAPLRFIDTKTIFADTTKIRTELGWKPKYDLDAIIKEMLSYED